MIVSYINEVLLLTGGSILGFLAAASASSAFLFLFSSNFGIAFNTYKPIYQITVFDQISAGHFKKVKLGALNRAQPLQFIMATLQPFTVHWMPGFPCLECTEKNYWTYTTWIQQNCVIFPEAQLWSDH